MKRLKFGLFILFGMFILNNSAWAQNDRVIAYMQTNFQGQNMILTDGWKGSRGFDRRIKSIKVPPGYRVTIYNDKDYKGTEATLTEDWNPGEGGWWTTQIRSIRVVRAEIQPPINPPIVEGFPVLYAGTNFDGSAEAIEVDKAELKDWDGSPHTIRSMRVPQGWYLVVYTKRNFRGDSYNINSNMTFAPGDQWYNKIRSIKVYKGKPPIQPR